LNVVVRDELEDTGSPSLSIVLDKNVVISTDDLNCPTFARARFSVAESSRIKPVGSREATGSSECSTFLHSWSHSTKKATVPNFAILITRRFRRDSLKESPIK